MKFFGRDAAGVKVGFTILLVHIFRLGVPVTVTVSVDVWISIVSAPGRQSQLAVACDGFFPLT